MPLKLPYKINNVILKCNDTLSFDYYDQSEEWKVVKRIPTYIAVMCKDLYGNETILYECTQYKTKYKTYKRNFLMKTIDPSNSERVKKSYRITIDNVDKWIKRILSVFERGELYIGDDIFYLDMFKRFKLSYKQIKAILTFEHKSSRFLDQKHRSIITKNPREIRGPMDPVDCGDYLLLADFMHCFDAADRGIYSGITANPEIIEWVEGIKQSYQQ